MKKFTCHIGILRGREKDIFSNFPKFASSVESYLREGSRHESGEPEFEVSLDSSRKDIYKIPNDYLTSTSNLQRTLRKFVSSGQKPGLEVEEIVILFADKFEGDDRLLGLMFDSGFSGNESYDSVPRQGCAIFVDAIRTHRPNPKEFERQLEYTTVHELGHLFNLWHIQGKNFMAKSRGGQKAYGDEYFQFHEEHKKYLRTVSSCEYFHPGGSDFGERGTVGVDDRDNEDRVPEKNLKLTLSMDPEEFWAFEPVELDVSLRLSPSSDRKFITVPDRIDPGYEEFELWIEEPDGARRRYRPCNHYCEKPKNRNISRKQPFLRDISIFGQSGGYTFNRAGPHKIWAVFRLPQKRFIRSNILKVTVKPDDREGSQYHRLYQELTHPGIPGLLFYRPGVFKKDLMKLLIEISGHYRNSFTGPLVDYALGRMFFSALNMLSSGNQKDKLKDDSRRYLESSLNSGHPKTNRYKKAETLIQELG
jgi:hypothetical protein